MEQEESLEFCLNSKMKYIETSKVLFLFYLPEALIHERIVLLMNQENEKITKNLKQTLKQIVVS